MTAFILTMMYLCWVASGLVPLLLKKRLLLKSLEYGVSAGVFSVPKAVEIEDLLCPRATIWLSFVVGPLIWIEIASRGCGTSYLDCKYNTIERLARYTKYKDVGSRYTKILKERESLQRVQAEKEELEKLLEKEGIKVRV